MINVIVSHYSTSGSYLSSPCTKVVSVVLVFASIVAGVSLILDNILDSYNFHEPCQILLMVCFVGLNLSALCTTFVYFD